MSNAILPKEQQSPFQRWEMNSFGDTRASTLVAQNSATAKITIEELAQIREQARVKAHAEGYEEGRASGFAQGLMEGAGEMENLRQIAAQMGDEVAKADAVIAKDVLELALDLSKAMLKTALAVRPELMLPIVSEAIRYLPSLQQPALLFLHPADAVLVKNQMADELEKAGWRLVDDISLERGGCRIDTATNQIDAGIDTRWQRLAEALGRQSEWLE